MPNPFFQFKQFVVFHDKCAMKVGTDGVLAGAWAQVDGAARILDIGTGSGLIALMLAQRNPQAFVTAVDIDGAAVEQARENVARSPWADRMEVTQLDIRQAPEDWKDRFDAIVSNPPYFVEAVKCPHAQRNTARHTDELDFGALLAKVAFLLSDEGCFSVILPATAASDFVALALKQGLSLSRQTWVHPRAGLPPKRVLMAFAKSACVQTETCHLAIEMERHVYTPEFEALAKPFYLAL